MEDGSCLSGSVDGGVAGSYAGSCGGGKGSKAEAAGGRTQVRDLREKGPRRPPPASRRGEAGRQAGAARRGERGAEARRKEVRIL